MARDDDGGPVKEPADALSQAARDFMPTRETTMIEYMKMLAVYEASNGGCCQTHCRASQSKSSTIRWGP